MSHKFETRAIHAGQEPEPAYGAVCTPDILVFDGQLEQSAEWSEALAGWEVASVRVEGARASARVSLEHACCAGPLRKTLELEKSVSGWKIAGPPLPLLTRKQ